MAVTIYHNPRCSKSRQTLELLRENGVDPVVVEYLKTPPTRDELRAIAAKLGMKAADLLRRKESEFAEAGLGGGTVTEDQALDAMARYPKLIERPIVVAGEDAAIGRPPENVLSLLGRKS